ncbi:MAG TPA: sensor histidine kinase [Abditibacteriaceae bacterium]|jgi:signal transduction histidine kinase
MPNLPDHFHALAAHLARRREAIFTRWRTEVDDDPTTDGIVRLTRAEFRDHVPRVLDALEARLSRGVPDIVHDQIARDLAGQHGAHRWQQGYDLNEMTREWGLLNVILVEEIEAFGLEQPEHACVLPPSRTVLARFINEGISGSVSEFYRLQRAEAESRAQVLEDAFQMLRDIQRERGQLLHEASHDLRGGLSVVQSAASLLDWERLPPEDRTATLRMLQSGVENVNRLLADLLDLARLDAGREVCEIKPFDAAQLLADICKTSHPLAIERGLSLEYGGAEPLLVEGDAAKVQRITQNLLLNALRYTTQGGVKVSWHRCDGEEPEIGRWSLVVRDTGPGMNAANSPLAHEIEDATQSAREMGALASNTPAPSDNGENSLAPGEGIGLSIVKKLCELLHATLELDSTPQGSEFRIFFPTKYE